MRVRSIKRKLTTYDAGSRLIYRLRDSRAFTLAEALIAVLIMLLVTGIVAAGIPAAARAYNRVVMASNAEVLLSTTMSALRNELALAKDIDIQDNSDYVAAKNGVKTGTRIIYYNPQTGAKSRITKGTGGNSKDIMYERYAADGIIIDGSKATGDAATAYGAPPERFMSEEVSDKNKELHINYTDVSYNETTGIVVFTGLTVTDKNGDATPAVRDTYSIRIIAE